MSVQKIKENKLEIFLLALLLVVTVFLRLPNLGYSDYIGDEHKAFIELDPGDDLYTFFTTQRKGPMQFIVSYIPYVFTGDFHNELVERAPFTLFSVLSIFVFYAFIKRWFSNKLIAFFSAFLFSVNGFIVGFSRIAQYQNLNLFFSALALYYYVDFLKPTKNLTRNTLFGTVAFCLSVLSHWDAVFVIPPIIYFVVKFLLNSKVDKKTKSKVILSNFLMGVIILTPFLIPYGYEQISNEANKQYFTRRVEMGYLNHTRHKFLIELYNPFLLIPLLVGLGAVSVLFINTSWVSLVWFLVNYAIFMLFVKKPDTHVYNFLIPAIVVSAVGLAGLIKKLKPLRVVLFTLVFVWFSFLAYQSYVLFADHSAQYPWEEESLADFICREHENRLGQSTKCGEFANKFETDKTKYTVKTNPPLFGFPSHRNWDKINNFVNNQNKIRGENYKYISNEAKTITEWYMDVGYGIYGGSGVYAVGIKNPVSLRYDWNFPQYGGKETVYEYENNLGETVVRIYRLTPEDLEEYR